MTPTLYVSPNTYNDIKTFYQESTSNSENTIITNYIEPVIFIEHKRKSINYNAELAIKSNKNIKIKNQFYNIRHK